MREILQKDVAQFTVWAFGSRANWTASKYSDLDLVIMSETPLDLSLSAAVSDDFAESDLPFKVDVLDWSTTDEDFRQIIEQNKVLLQEGK